MAICERREESMSAHIGLAIDPGLSSGVCLFGYADDRPFERIGVWQVTNGAVGLANLLDFMQVRVEGGEMRVRKSKLDALVVEKFTPRVNEGFSHTRASVEPLRGEGVLLGRGFSEYIDWAEPSAQYFMGGGDLADKKKSCREFLKEQGLRVTGSMVGQPDAHDATSAQLHAIAYLRRKRHMPTLVTMFG